MKKVLYILGQLNDSDIEWMSQAGRRRSVAKNDVIIRQGVEVPDLFIVLTGAVEVDVAGVGVVARLSSGDIIGEMSFVDKAPPSATVRGIEPSVVLALDKHMMEARLAQDIGFAARFYKALAIYLADRLRGTTRSEPGVNLASHDVQQDELDETVLDGIAMGGVRFQHMLKRLMGEEA